MLNEGSTDYRIYNPVTQYNISEEDFNTSFEEALIETKEIIEKNSTYTDKLKVLEIIDTKSKFSQALKRDFLFLSCENNNCSPESNITNFEKPIKTRLSTYPLSNADKQTLNALLMSQFKKHIFEKMELSKNDFQYRYFKSKDSNDLIHEGDSISVSVLQAFICDFKEHGLPKFENGLPIFSGGCHDSVNPSGEILVSARILERNKNNAITFNYSDIKNKGRVIFYSEDVQGRGQYLNFSNLPVYGPISYSGNPLYLEFNILELDNDENDKNKALISTLAKLGSTAYPPASPVLGVLNSLGSSLLSGDQDDLEFRYHMELVPVTNLQSDSLKRPFIREGIYVFLRSEDREEDIKWNTINYDPETGRLRKNGKFFREETYLIIQISKGDNSDNLDTGQTVSSFLSQNKADNTSYSNAVIQNLNSAKTILENRNKTKRITNAIKIVANNNFDRTSQKGLQQLHIAFGGLCEVLKDEGTEKQVMSSEKIDKLLTYLSKSKGINNPSQVLREYIKPNCKDKVLDSTVEISKQLWG